MVGNKTDKAIERTSKAAGGKKLIKQVFDKYVCVTLCKRFIPLQQILKLYLIGIHLTYI